MSETTTRLPSDTTRVAWSINEIAEALGVSRDAINDLLRRHELGSIKVGRRRLITRQHLDAFIAAAEV